MADVFEPAVRSYVMSRIKGKNTKPEMVVRSFLHRRGYRFNLHGKFRGTLLPGRPDIVLPKYRMVVFVHGCFWHAHKGCRYFTIPETRSEWWKEKLLGNRARDMRHRDELEKIGWKVHVIWTCDMKSQAAIEEVGKELLEVLAVREN